jgi:hypothetical protein
MQGKSGEPADQFGLKGRVEIWAYRGIELLDYQDLHNIILYQGNAEVIRTLSTISPTTKPRIITRMAVGDLGTIPADPTVPKVPVKTMTALYHEIYRKDCDSRTLTLSGSTNKCQFVATFAATDIVISAYSNPSQPRVNEVGLIIIDPTAPSGLVRSAVTSPNVPPSDEVLLSIRTFKSIPFEIANDVSVTIRYTLYME